MYKENITVEELAQHELSWFKGEIVLVDNLRTFYEVFPRLLRSDLLGFDTETRPTFKKGKKNSVSLIQLSTGDLACLFRINKIGIPNELTDLLSDPSIIKAGVAVHDDIRFLKGIRKFSPDGFRISKRQQVTDWEAEQLTEAQQIYAATDAWVCYQIYEKLVNGYEV
jgi:ribonuclease D